MSETSIVMHCDVVIRRIVRRLDQLDAKEQKKINDFIDRYTKPKRKCWLFSKPEITKEMAEKILDERYSGDRFYTVTNRQYLLRNINFNREKLNQIKKMCYDACDGKITLSKKDYQTVMGK